MKPSRTFLPALAFFTLSGCCDSTGPGGVTYEELFADAMYDTLGQLVILQDMYFAAHGAYSVDPRALGLWGAVNTTVAITMWGDGWSAEATHTETDRMCMVYDGASYGGAEMSFRGQTLTAGEPACDPPYPEGS